MKNDTSSYLHGFTSTEQQRLIRQAQLLEHVIYSQIDLSEVGHLLEIGAGVGAQTEILLRRFPHLKITGVERSLVQIETAKNYLKDKSYAQGRFEFLEMDATNLEIAEEQKFSGAFLCWVLEHIPNPLLILNEIRRVLTPGSIVIATEVMNHSFFMDPYAPSVWKYWMAFNDYQLEVLKGDPFVGAKLGNMFQEIGLRQIQTNIKTLHFDNRTPHKRRLWIKFWKDLLFSAKDQLIESGLVSKELVEEATCEFDKNSRHKDAVFFYSFMQAQAIVY